MSAITLPNSGPKVTTAFCDQRFQFIRVVVDVLTKKCIALFYKVISIFCHIFSKELVNRYRLQAKYYNHISSGKWIAYSSYGSKVINFSYNRFSNLKEATLEGKTEWDMLKEQYGDRCIEAWFEVGSSEMPLFKVELRRRQIDDPCCFGITLDHIYRCFRRVRKGFSIMDSLKSVSQKFINGPTKRAEIIQVFQSGFCVYPSPFREKWMAIREKESYWEKEHQGMEKDGSRKTLKEQVRVLEEINKKLREIKEEQDALIQEMNLINSSEELVCLKLKRRFLREKLLSEAAGITIDWTKCCMRSDLEKVLKDLPENCYLMSLTNQITSPPLYHAVSIIKTPEGEYFLQDPNYGTLALNLRECSDHLKKIATNFVIYTCKSS